MRSTVSFLTTSCWPGPPSTMASASKSRACSVVADRGSIATLYPNTDSWRHGVVMDSISLHLTTEQWQRFLPLDGKFVLLGGIFEQAGDDEYGVVSVTDLVERILDISK